MTRVTWAVAIIDLVSGCAFVALGLQALRDYPYCPQIDVIDSYTYIPFLCGDRARAVTFAGAIIVMLCSFLIGLVANEMRETKR
jgi:hypothetical protein